MPKNSNFCLPRPHRFRPKFDFKVMVPNHGGDPLMFILGPMGSHWVQKMGRNRKNYHAPKFEFSTTPRSSISTKIRLYGYGAKSRWGPLRVHHGANGVLFGSKKWVETVKITMPQNSNFRLPRGHRFRPKFDFTVMAPNHGGDPSLRVHLEANGVLFGSKKWIKLVNNYHAPKFEFSTTLQSSISAKIRI